MPDAPASPSSDGFFVRDRAHTPAGTLTVSLVGRGVLGALAWCLTGALPPPWGTLANTSALWGLAAFAAASLQRARALLAVGAGVLALLGMVVVFALLSAASAREWLVFVAVATVAGAVFGLAAAHAQGVRSRGRVASAAVTGGIIAGEGLYGILVVDTAGPQWWTELAVGGVVSLLIVRSARERLLALALVAVVAVALFGAYLAYDAVLSA